MSLSYDDLDPDSAPAPAAAPGASDDLFDGSGIYYPPAAPVAPLPGDIVQPPVPAAMPAADPTADLGRVTSYGYNGDPYGGPAASASTTGPRGNPLDSYSLAVSPDNAARLRAAGYRLGDWVTLQTSKGEVLRRWDDLTPPSVVSRGRPMALTGRWDFHAGDDAQPSYFSDAAVMGFSRPGGNLSPPRAQAVAPMGPGQADPAAEPLELPGIPFPAPVAGAASVGRMVAGAPAALFPATRRGVVPTPGRSTAPQAGPSPYDVLDSPGGGQGQPAASAQAPPSPYDVLDNSVPAAGFDFSALKAFEPQPAPTAPPASGFLPSAEAAGMQNLYNTAAALPDALAGLKTAGTSAFYPSNQPLLDQTWARIRALDAQTRAPFTFAPSGVGFGAPGVQKPTPAALDRDRLIILAKALSNDPTLWMTSADLRQQGADQYARFGADPDARNFAAQAGRAVGNLGAMAPFLTTGLGLAPAAAQMAGETYESTFRAAEQQARAKGLTDEAQISEEAERVATGKTLDLAPTLMAYTVGGKLVTNAVRALLPTASPIVRGLVTGTASAAANSTVSAAARAVAGQNVVPNLEQLIPDLAFGAVHGAGDAASQRGSPAYLNARIDALKADLRGKGATPPADSGPSTPPNASPQPDSPAPSPAAEAPPRAPAPADSPAPAADDELDIFNQGPDPWQDYPRVTPAAESAAAAPPEPQPDAVAANPDEAADYLYRSLFSRLATGKIPEKGSVGRALQEAKPAYDAGTITSPEDLRAWMTGDPALRARLAQINGGAAPQSDSGGPQFSQRPAADDPATIAQANGFWQRAFRVLGPGLARQFRLFVGQNAVDQFAEDNKGRLPTTEDKAAVDTALRSVYMFNAASRPGAEPGDVLNLMHESAHAFEGALQPETQAKLGELMQAERQAKAGPVFGNRPVGPDGKPLAMDPRALTDPKEWFAERMALQNFQWANQRVRAGVSDGSLIGRMAASQRLAWVKLQQLVTNRPVDFISARMRNFLAKGDPAYAGGYGAGGAPQFSRRPEDPVAEAEKLHALARSQTMLPDPQDLRPDFHVGTLVGRALMPWIQKMGETARSISPDDPVWSKLDPRHQQRLRATLNRGNQQIQHARAMWPEFRSRMADVVASLPDRRVRDARSGQMADPFAGLKQAFPGGEAGELEPAVSRAADLSQAVFARSHPGFAENGQRIPGGHSIRDFLNILEVLHEAGAGDYTRGIDELTRREGRSQTTAEALEQARLEHEGGAMLGEETRHELPGFEGYSRSDTGPQFSRRPIEHEFKDAAEVVKEKDGQTPKTFYHGTANAEALARSGVFDVQRQDPRALYGPGFYFTGDPKVAGGDGTGGGYESKNRWQSKRVSPGEDPQALAAQLEAEGYETIPHDDLVQYRKPGNPGVVPAHVLLKSPLDMDAVAGDKGSLADGLMQPDAKGRWHNGPLMDQLARRYPQYDWDYLAEKLGQALDNENLSNGQIYQGIAKALDEDGVKFGKERLNEFLRSQGYDGITHIGGGNTGGAAHRVVIAFHPEQIYGVHGGLERKAGLGPQYFSRRPAPLEEEGKLKHTARAVSEGYKASRVKSDLAQTYDGSETRAVINAEQISNKIRDAFHGNRQDLESAALAYETGGQRWKLQDERNRVARGKPAIEKKYGEVMDYALEHFDRLFQTMKEVYEPEVDKQSALEAEHGINYVTRKNYVTHVLHDPEMRSRTPAVLGIPDTAGKSRYFIKDRDFASLGEALAAGMDPKSTNVADLVQHRVLTGERLVQEAQWISELKTVLDPTDLKKLVTDPDLVERVVPKRETPNAKAGTEQGELFEGEDGQTYKRKADGTSTRKDEVAPEGYSMVRIGSGKSVPVHNQYASHVRSFFEPSAIRNRTFGRLLLNLQQGTKHGTVLIDLYHVANVGFRGLIANNGHIRMQAPLSLLEYRPSTLRDMVQRGELPQKVLDYARANRPDAVALVRHGLNVGGVADALYNEADNIITAAIRQIPKVGDPVADGIQAFSKWTFQKLTRAQMLDTALTYLRRNRARMKGESESEILYHTAREVNQYYGNIGHQGFFTSRTGQDFMRLVSFAASWMSGTFRHEINSYRQLATIPANLLRGRGMGPSNSAMATAKAVGLMFVLGNIVNYVNTGHSTLQNEDGHKMDAYVGGGAHGFYISPLSIVAKYGEQMMRYIGRAHVAGWDPDAQLEAAKDAAEQILSNKLSNVGRAAKTFLTGRDYAGRPLRGFTAQAAEAAWNMAPLPIFTGPFLDRQPGELLPRLTGENAPGAWERQLAASFGLHLIPADGPEAKMYAAMRQFRPDHGTNDPSDYLPLRRYLDAGDTDRARAELLHLVTGKDAKDPKQIDRSMGFTGAGWEPTRYSGRDRATEGAAVGHLSPALRQTYQEAVAAARSRAQLYQQVRASVAQQLAQLAAKASAAKREQIRQTLQQLSQSGD